MTGQIYIRRGGYADMNACEALLMRSFEEDHSALGVIDRAASYRMTLDMIELGCLFMAFEVVSDKSEKAVAALLVRPTPWHLNPKIMYLETLHYYVLPEYRARVVEGGSHVGVALLASVADAAMKAGAHLIVNILFDDGRIEAKTKMLKRKGYVRVGGKFMLSPPVADQETKAA